MGIPCYHAGLLSDLLPLFAALAAAVMVYVLRERHRRRTTVQPSAPDLTIPQAFASWAAAPHPDAPFIPAALVAPEGTAAMLEETERRALATANPRLAIREAVLDNAVLALHLDALVRLPEAERGLLLQGYAPGMEPFLLGALAGATARWVVLRHYTRLKYDDAVPDDWFQQFLRMAGPYVAEKVRLAREYVVSFDEGAARFVEVYDALLAQLRRELLATAPKKRFPPSDLPPLGR